MVARPRNIKQTIATLCLAFAAFLVIVTALVVVLGIPLSAGGLIFIMPLILILVVTSAYCLWTGRTAR